MIEKNFNIKLEILTKDNTIIQTFEFNNLCGKFTELKIKQSPFSKNIDYEQIVHALDNFNTLFNQWFQRITVEYVLTKFFINIEEDDEIEFRDFGKK